MSNNEKSVQQFSYGTAFIPRSFVVCGVKLKPFCLGHIILLEESKNPLIDPNSETTVSMDLGLYSFFLALMICSLTYEEGLILLDNTDELKELSERFSHNLIKVMDLDPNWNFYTAINAFKNYMKYYLDMPIYQEEHVAEVSTPSGQDWKNGIIMTFKKIGYSTSEIINMAMNRLFIEWTAYAEGEGAVKVLSKPEVEQIKYLQQQKLLRERKPR